MTTAADDSAVEEAFEAYLAGRPAPGAAGLVSFADAVRASATEPGRPNAALAELLATGLLVDQSGPAPRPARRSRRRRTRMLAAALFSKIATAGLAAKAATVAGVAVVGLTTVGFTGNLGPAQHPFATLVDHATPFTAPDPTADPSLTDEPTTPVTDATPIATPTPTAGDTTSTGDGTDATESAHPSNFGQKVSDAAHNGGVDGQQVSQWAHEKNDERKTATTAATPSPSEPTESHGPVRTSPQTEPASGASHAAEHGGPKH